MNVSVYPGMCVYVCMCVCTYVRIEYSESNHVRVHACKNMYVPVYVSMNVSNCIPCMCVNMYVCMCVCMYVST